MVRGCNNQNFTNPGYRKINKAQRARYRVPDFYISKCDLPDVVFQQWLGYRTGHTFSRVSIAFECVAIVFFFCSALVLL